MRYSVPDHAALLVYLNAHPYSCYQVGKAIGYTGKPPGSKLEVGEQSMEEWFIELAHEYFLADKPGGKRGGRDHRIFINHTFPAVPTIADLVEEIALQVEKDSDN